jgi:serine O-acetyltransferase
VTATDPSTATAQELRRAIRARHPRLIEALRADALVAVRYRGEAQDLSSPLEVALAIVRLALVSDAFLAQMLYRVKARLQALGVPVLPRIAHRLAIAAGQVSIGDPVVVAPGLYLPHGQVVIDGLVEIGEAVAIAPFVTVGLLAGNWNGPVIERGASLGTGAKVLGPVRVGAGARIGANAVVLSDVPAGATAVGAPARPV